MAPPGRGRAFAGIGLSLFAVAWMLWLLDARAIGEVAAVLRRADAAWFASALALSLTVNPLLRIGRSLAVLGPLPPRGEGSSLRELTPSLLLIEAANSLLPARAGDALYPLLLHERHGYPFATLAAAQLVEKVNQLLSLWMIAVMAAVLADPPPALSWPLQGFVVIGLAVAAGASWALSRKPSPPRGAFGAKAQGFLGRLRQALSLLAVPRVWRRALLCSWVSDLVDATMIGLCLAAVGVRVAPAACLLVLLAVNLAIAVPSMPGQVGTFEAAAMLALGGLGVGAVPSLAFALLYHAACVLPAAVLGALGWLLPGPARAFAVSPSPTLVAEGAGPR